MPNNKEKERIEKVSGDLKQILIPGNSNIYRHFVLHEIDVLRLLSLALKGINTTDSEKVTLDESSKNQSEKETPDDIVGGASTNYSPLNYVPEIDKQKSLFKK